MDVLNTIIALVIAVGIMGTGLAAVVRQEEGMRRFARWYFGGILRTIGRVIGWGLRSLADLFDRRGR